MIVPDLTLLDQDVISKSVFFYWYVEDLLGAIQTLIIVEAWDGGRRSISWVPSQEVRDIYALLFDRWYLPVASHMSSSR